MEMYQEEIEKTKKKKKTKNKIINNNMEYHCFGDITIRKDSSMLFEEGPGPQEANYMGKQQRSGNGSSGINMNGAGKNGQNGNKNGKGNKKNGDETIGNTKFKED